MYENAFLALRLLSKCFFSEAKYIRYIRQYLSIICAFLEKILELLRVLSFCLSSQRTNSEVSRFCRGHYSPPLPLIWGGTQRVGTLLRASHPSRLPLAGLPYSGMHTVLTTLTSLIVWPRRETYLSVLAVLRSFYC